MTLPTELLPLSLISMARLRDASAGSLRQGSGRPAETLAEAGGQGRIRTSVDPKVAGFTAQCH
jgi:hypothetical protein